MSNTEKVQPSADVCSTNCMTHRVTRSTDLFVVLPGPDY